MKRKKIIVVIIIVIIIVVITLFFIFLKPLSSYFKSKILDYQESQCEKQNGLWSCNESFGGCMGGYACILPFKDARKPCQNPGQCSGKHCILSDEQLNQLKVVHINGFFYSYFSSQKVPVFHSELCPSCTLEFDPLYATKYEEWPEIMDLPSGFSNQGVCISYPMGNCDGILEMDNNKIKILANECLFY
ncbi:MAG: hypothetical protein WC518_01980 [Patescibacteria group bacterium]